MPEQLLARIQRALLPLEFAPHRGWQPRRLKRNLVGETQGREGGGESRAQLDQLRFAPRDAAD